MPGGVSTVTNTLPDLESFLARRRIQLKLWLDSNKITTVEDFSKFLSTNSLWTISQNLVDQVQELLKPQPTPEMTVVVTVPVVVEAASAELLIEAVSPEDSLEQSKDELIVPVIEEPLQMVEEVSVISSQSFKERKKSR